MCCLPSACIQKLFKSSEAKIVVQIKQEVLNISPFLYQYEEGKKRRKPNYSSVDLSEVEWEDRDDVVSDVSL